MEATKENIAAAAAIMSIFAEDECTVAQAQSILSFCSRLCSECATVPERNYFEDLTSKLTPYVSRMIISQK